MKDRRLVSSTLSSRIIEYLRAKGHSQAAIARLLGVSQPYISLIKIRERSLTLDHVERLADRLDMPLGALFIAISESRDVKKPKKRNLAFTRIMKQADVAAASALRAMSRRKAG